MLNIKDIKMKYIKIVLIGLGLAGCTNQPNVSTGYEKLTPIEQSEQEDMRLEDMIEDSLNSIEKNHFRRR